LQAAGNKSSRDMIAASYRAYVEIDRLVTELLRQFYDEARSFRILGDGAAYKFVELSNAQLGEQSIGFDTEGNELFRKPIFDIKIKAQKRDVFSRMEQNERAKELYAMGFFNPEKAQEAQSALEMMDFEGIESVRERITQGQTLMNICMQLQNENAMLKMAITGQPQPTISAGGGAPATAETPSGAKNEVASGIMQAQTPMTGYGEALAKRSVPSIE
jgi:hypothetical protein